ncbi:M15 family metallopeptidase [Mesorhizobium sp. B2-3-15]|uniref:M15 family metallopeptidase n=1 Tax=Mesorhizobium sp. B2-3-15 TaxID=2589949 RepID=UPI0024848D60|nr:M15 family metallopeptidase [Mesorhizobium sp. B2-3-15]
MRQTIQRIGFCALMIAGSALPAPADPLPAGFVRLAEVAPSIRQDIRYANADNFLHRKVNGYDAPVCILTREAAEALSRVQRAIATRGLTLVVFDCYRPARAVADMGEWTAAGGPDPQWYPKVKRGDLIAKGYVANCPVIRAARPSMLPSRLSTVRPCRNRPAARSMPTPSISAPASIVSTR